MWRVMSASSCVPTSRFQPGIAAIYDCTGASPSAFAICGLPPESSATFLPFRADGFTSAARDLSFAAAFVERFGLFGNFCECKSAKIKRAEPALTILNECDHFTVTSGQHHHANTVLLGERRRDCLDVPHSNSKRFVLGDDLNRALQIVRVLARIVR